MEYTRKKVQKMRMFLVAILTIQEKKSDPGRSQEPHQDIAAHER